MLIMLIYTLGFLIFIEKSLAVVPSQIYILEEKQNSQLHWLYIRKIHSVSENLSKKIGTQNVQKIRMRNVISHYKFFVVGSNTKVKGFQS